MVTVNEKLDQGSHGHKQWLLSRNLNQRPRKQNPLMLKLKIQYFGLLMPRAVSLVKILMLGKIEGKRRRGRQRVRCLDSITDSMDMNLSKLWEIVED